MTTRAERFYQRLLVLLPAAFRDEAGAELLEVFRASHARMPAGSIAARLSFWWRTAADLVVTSAAERRGARQQGREPQRPFFSQRNLMDSLHDVRLAFRSLLKHRGFAATAVLTLALGIGATVAIFSVVNSVLIEPLPYRDPARLVLLWQELRARNVPEFPFPPGDIPDLRAKGTLLEDVAVLPDRAAVALDRSRRAGADPHRVRLAEHLPAARHRRCSRTRFRRRRRHAAASAAGSAAGGRGTSAAAPAAAPATPAAPQPPPPPPLATILSHEFWQRHFGGDPSVVGKPIRFGGATGFIAGIAAPGAQLLFPPRTNVERAPDLWVASRTNFATAPARRASSA